jgi:hypothetical protein
MAGTAAPPASPVASSAAPVPGASVQISGDENTTSPGQCGEEEAGDDYVSLELQGPSDDGCLSIGQEANGEWRIEDLSNSIWNQAPG